ncbi:SDR family oxidoreductase [Neptuniibacter caesariensis]|uniref:Oxidoreductase, short-chain dehydrogenase/reductase family protein n=1 Tax=Neptuniibacter caesariensis TaxID=207954 RepID=A0A7U8GS49_NEPCE|nr:SDR family oxidoreductase [Neptuniibacter caesariensis]EAR62127.1 oxidoreductase, short-chain dehydrogenase/reductase family protein [Oceanospirillum sp. MED92] [Neptuniibacter caesariensis]
MPSVLITGCSSGIGYYCAKALKQEGYQVFATARKEEDVQKLREQGFLSYQLDLNSTQSIDEALSCVLEQTDGTIDVLFNNGAYGQPGAVEDLSREVLRNQFETNLFGTHELTCKVIKIMRKQGRGRIIQNSSVLGLITLKYRGAYNASKFALEGLTDTLRQELQGSNIHISLIEPGPVESDFRKNAYQAFKENITTDDSAHQSVYEAVELRLSKQDSDRKKDPFTLGPESVYKPLLHAMTSKKPKARYYVTTPTWIFGILRRVLSTRMLDWILVRVSDDENK